MDLALNNLQKFVRSIKPNKPNQPKLNSVLCRLYKTLITAC